MERSVVSRRLGQLAKEPFPRLLLALFRKRYTGDAVLARPSGEQAICRLVNGLLVDIELVSASTLADVLRDLGLVDDRAYLKMGVGAQSPVVEHLSAARGAGVEQEALWRGYRLFMRRRIIKLCGWVDGMYELRGEALPPGASMSTAELSPTIPRQRCLDPLPELLHGISESCDEVRLRQELSIADGCTVSLGSAATAELLGRLALSKAESDLVEKIRSSSFMVDDLVRMGALPPRRVLAILWMLSLMGVLELKPTSIATSRPSGGSTTGVSAAASPAASVPAGTPSAARPVAPAPESPPNVPRGGTNPGVAPSSPPAAPRAPGAPPPIPAAALAPPPASTTTLPELPFEGVQVRTAILEKAAVIDGQDLFAVLDVPPSATAARIREAYLRLVKTYHPDRLATYHLEVMRPLAERVFQRISQAYATLSDDKRRKEYEATLNAVGAEAAGDPTRRLIEAESHFQSGEALLRRKDYVKAVEALRLAVMLNPDEAEHHAALGWAIFSSSADAKDASKAEEAKALLQKAIEKQPKLVRAYYYLGELLLSQGELDKAVVPLRKGLEIQPDHVEALRCMRIVQMRLDKRNLELKEAKKSTGGLLDRLRKR